MMILYRKHLTWIEELAVKEKFFCDIKHFIDYLQNWEKLEFFIKEMLNFDLK